MNNRPIAITPQEFKEIAASQEIQGMWGDVDAQEAEAMLKNDYIVKFNYVDCDQKYEGELFVIQWNLLDYDLPATRLIRGKDNQLVIFRNHPW